jgi:DNA recombination protein RmuC
LKCHAQNVSKHTGELSKKSYWGQFPRSTECVILFIPGVQFLSAAPNEEANRIDSALAQKIRPATPTSCLALLKVFAHSWQQRVLADNIEEIRKLAGDLYGRLGTFVTHLNKVRKQLSSSVDHYNKAVGSLDEKFCRVRPRLSSLVYAPKKKLRKPNRSKRYRVHLSKLKQIPMMHPSTKPFSNGSNSTSARIDREY